MEQLTEVEEFNFTNALAKHHFHENRNFNFEKMEILDYESNFSLPANCIVIKSKLLQ